LGIGDWGLAPIPNPPSPIPIKNHLLNLKYFLNNFQESINKNKKIKE
jgi:hypothetical protein